MLKGERTILFLLHLPPPVHGSSMVGQYIEKSPRINREFSANYINLLASKEVSHSGKFSLSKVGGFLITGINLLIELIRRKPDLCYLALTVSGLAFYRDVITVALLKIFGVKRIYHLHNKGVAPRQNHPVYRPLYRFIFKDADVILLSKFLYEDVKHFVPENKIHICPNGIPDSISSSKFEIPNSIPRTRDQVSTGILPVVKILFLSNLIESKGVFVLLEACAMLKSKGITFQLDFIGGEGDISREQFEEKLQQLGLQGIAIYHGKKYGGEKHLAFSEADIFAFPTFYDNECFPLVLLEAMQFGLPVVSTYEGGIRDMVDDGKTGFLVPQKDVVSLAGKLETLIADPVLREQMGDAGHLKYKNEFTLKHFEKKLIEAIQKTL